MNTLKPYPNITFFWLTVFAVAMGFMESSVVIYLRSIYYPEGFAFPLKLIDPHIAFTEIIREVGTILMLISVAIFTGRNRTEKLGNFIYTFAVWDIFYYIFLKIILDWPASLFTWDVLFLIPTTWVGPVLAPIILSLVMIVFSISISIASNKYPKPEITKLNWTLLIVGSLIIIISFTLDYSLFLFKEFSVRELFSGDMNLELIEYATRYTPRRFFWLVYIFGTFSILVAIFRYSWQYHFKRINKGWK
jgi:hypothetical protein